MAPVDVVRPTVTTLFGTVADVVGVAAAAGTIAVAAVALVSGSRQLGGSSRATAALRAATLVATAGALAFRLADLIEIQAVDDLVGAVTSRRAAVLLARVVLLGVLEIVHRSPEALTPTERRAATRVVVALLAVTVAMDAPRSATGTGLAMAGGVTALTLGFATWLVVSVHDRRPDLRATPVAVVVAVAVAVVPSIVVVNPPGSVPTASLAAESDGVRFDLTVSPAAPGTNELHLYAFDRRGRPVALSTVQVGIDGAPAQELLVAGPNHLLTYRFGLSGDAPWPLRIEAVTTDGRTLEVRQPLERP